MLSLYEVMTSIILYLVACHFYRSVPLYFGGANFRSAR